MGTHLFYLELNQNRSTASQQQKCILGKEKKTLEEIWKKWPSEPILTDGRKMWLKILEGIFHYPQPSCLWSNEKALFSIRKITVYWILTSERLDGGKLMVEDVSSFVSLNKLLSSAQIMSDLALHHRTFHAGLTSTNRKQILFLRSPKLELILAVCSASLSTEDKQLSEPTQSELVLTFLPGLFTRVHSNDRPPSIRWPFLAFC